MTIDLSPFGFTGTESTVYGALLKLGSATGYAVARATRLARANAYAALEGLVLRRAAARVPGKPVRYRPADPTALLADLAQRQAEALDRLERSLRGAAAESTPTLQDLSGDRATQTVIQQLVARAEVRVAGVVSADLWRGVVPALRRAAARATLDVRVAGEVGDTAGLATGSAPADAPTLLVLDDATVVMAQGASGEVAGFWSSHPLVVELARRALAAS